MAGVGSVFGGNRYAAANQGLQKREHQVQPNVNSYVQKFGNIDIHTVAKNIKASGSAAASGW